MGGLSLETKVPFAHRDWQNLRRNNNNSVHGGKKSKEFYQKAFLFLKSKTRNEAD